MFSFSAIFLSSLINIVVASKVRYDFYRVYRVFPNTREQFKELENLEEIEIVPDDWGLNKSASVMVPPQQHAIFHNFINRNKIDFEVDVENLQTLINKENHRISKRATGKFDWGDYQPLNKVYDWLDELENNHENVKVVVGGRTHECRDIKGIEINNGKGLPGVVIESGIHAREWITVAASTWIINEILKPSSELIWRKFNYLYFPSFNPDGYVYSWTEDRLWRKTRKLYISGIRRCYGVDGNRNWDSHWGRGMSIDPCKNTYAGPRPFSEIEMKTLSEYLAKVAEVRNNKIYISYHSYFQTLMFPWGHTGVHAPQHETWKKVAELAASAFRNVHGTEIRSGSIFETVYQASGVTTDYYYEKLNATFSFIYEMRDKGRYKWLLPPEQIIPVGEEQLASLKIILQEYLKLKN